MHTHTDTQPEVTEGHTQREREEGREAGKEGEGRETGEGSTAHLVGQKLLVDLPMVHLLLNCTRCDEAVHNHLTGLPNAPCPLPRLHVRGRVEVRVIHQNPVQAPTLLSQSLSFHYEVNQAYGVMFST